MQRYLLVGVKSLGERAILTNQAFLANYHRFLCTIEPKLIELKLLQFMYFSWVRIGFFMYCSVYRN